MVRCMENAKTTQQVAWRLGERSGRETVQVTVTKRPEPPVEFEVPLSAFRFAANYIEEQARGDRPLADLDS